MNGARFLPNLLDCIQRQSLENWEHIVVDAGSTDGSQEIVQKQAELDPRLKLVVVPGLALYPSIFRGFDQATGDIMTWIANDDLYARFHAPVCLPAYRAFGQRHQSRGHTHPVHLRRGWIC